LRTEATPKAELQELEDVAFAGFAECPEIDTTPEELPTATCVETLLYLQKTRVGVATATPGRHLADYREIPVHLIPGRQSVVAYCACRKDRNNGRKVLFADSVIRTFEKDDELLKIIQADFTELGVGKKPSADDEATSRNLVNTLASDVFVEREAAHDALMRLKHRATPVLREASEHPDAEVALRSKELLENVATLGRDEHTWEMIRRELGEGR
jgi:hypothetical protein